MQSPTGQYGTQAGEPAQPVQHSVITASSLGRFLRGVAIPSDFGSIFTTSVAMQRIITQEPVACHAHDSGMARAQSCLRRHGVSAVRWSDALSDVGRITGSRPQELFSVRFFVDSKTSYSHPQGLIPAPHLG